MFPGQQSSSTTAAETGSIPRSNEQAAALLQARQLQVAVAELQSLKKDRRVFARSGDVFLISKRDVELEKVKDQLKELQQKTQAEKSRQ